MPFAVIFESKMTIKMTVKNDQEFYIKLDWKIIGNNLLLINLPYRSVVLIVFFFHASGINRLWFLGNF